MNDIPLKQIIDASLSKIGSVADVNTVIGDPITLPDGITVIPFSKVSVGFASGGADYDGKAPVSSEQAHFAGGNGIGLSVVPLGFIVINGTDIKIIDLKNPVQQEPASAAVKAIDAINTIIEKAPDIIDKIKGLKKDRKSDEADAE